MIICNVCGELRDPTKKKCANCNRVYQRTWLAKNKDVQLERVKKNTEKMRNDNLTRLIAYFREHPCVVCGETDPIVLEFDHLRDKKGPISDMLRKNTWNTIEKEIEKCQVLCANCHRRKTAQQFNWLILKHLDG